MWTGAKELKAQLLRLWDRGELLRDAAKGQSRFPLRLILKGPGSTDITDRFDGVRAWAAEVAAIDSVRLEWLDIRHRVQGLQRLPASAWVDSAEDAMLWLGKRREWTRFAALMDETRLADPALMPWLEKRPLQALDLAQVWTRLLAVVGWVKQHPRCGIYLRQMDLPGVHSKFLEAHRSVLAELLDLALPADAIFGSRSGISDFARRYGFLDKPTRIRLRLLDPATPLIEGADCPDITLDATSFSRLRPPIRRVFITENETNFLAFPCVSEALVIFGAGYGWEALARAQWLHDCSVVYWGDIDTHGFAILNQLRGQFAHVTSFLMDHETLNAHSAFWGTEDKPSIADLPNLTKNEHALYDDLRDNRIRKGLRLEQEHVGFGWVNAGLCALFGD